MVHNLTFITGLLLLFFSLVFFFLSIIREQPFEDYTLHSDVIQQLSGKQQHSSLFGVLMKHNWH